MPLSPRVHPRSVPADVVVTNRKRKSARGLDSLWSQKLASASSASALLKVRFPDRLFTCSNRRFSSRAPLLSCSCTVSTSSPRSSSRVSPAPRFSQRSMVRSTCSTNPAIVLHASRWGFERNDTQSRFCRQRTNHHLTNNRTRELDWLESLHYVGTRGPYLPVRHKLPCDNGLSGGVLGLLRTPNGCISLRTVFVRGKEPIFTAKPSRGAPLMRH